MARPTTWFTPLDRPPFVAEHHDPAGPPARLRALEISSRSGEMFGRTLSAMRLPAPGSDGDRGTSVESVYQAAKCYGDGGPAERPAPNGHEAKRIDRERRGAGPLRGFHHEGTFWPAASGSAFYDRLWIRAAAFHAADRLEDLKAYDAYTDQFHRPGRSVACQARSAAMLVGLDRAGRLGRVHNADHWADTLGLRGDARPREANAGDMHGTARRRATGPAAGNDAPAPAIEARVLVCGSRDFTDVGLLGVKLDEVRKRLGGVPMRVISGAARGADSLAAGWARLRGIPCDEYPAEWERYGRSAGYRRNERMLAEGRPHVVVAFPQGESRGTRMMMDIASRAGVAVEEVDAASRTTLTDTGRLHDIAAIARRDHAAGRPAGPVGAPPVGQIARLRNGDPHTHGEVRVVVAGTKAGADERLVHAKLDEVLARAHPAALRLAVGMQPGPADLSTVATAWARRRGVHCDQYRIDEPDEAKTLAARMVAEQKPHLAVTFPRGEESAQRLAAAAARAGVTVEAVDPSGINRTASGELADLSEARRSRERPAPDESRVVPVRGRSAAETAKRLGTRATDAAWAKRSDEHAGEHRSAMTLNLRERAAFDAVRDGSAVRIDRKTEWGNPFPLQRNAGAAERRDVIERYREYLAESIDSGHVDIEKLARLDGKALACHCAPVPCHGDVLSQAAAWAAGIERERGRERDAPADRAGGHERGAAPATHVFDAGDGDWDDGPGAEPEQIVIERPPADQPQHPDDLAADQLERYRERIAKAGAGERQLATVDADAAALRESAGRARVAEHLSAERPASGELQSALDENRQRRERAAEQRADNPDSSDATIAGLLGHGATNTETEPPQGPRRQRAGGRPPDTPPAPAPAPPAAAVPTREVRILATGAWKDDDPGVVYAKLDEVRQRIAGAPMRVVTGDGRGADRSAAGWAAEAGVPCDVYPADWETDGPQAGRRRDERMIAEAKPHAVVSFARPDDQGGEHLVNLAHRDRIPYEEVDETGRTLTPPEDRPDLEAIGRRSSDAKPDNPRQPPSPALGASTESVTRSLYRDNQEQAAAAR